MKSITDYPNYAVTKDGRVWSYKRHMFLKDQVNPRGYKQVGLYKSGKRSMVAVHRIVAKAFLPNQNSLKFINHKDSNKQNNNFNNLEWCTTLENMLHAYVNCRGAGAKLTPELVKDMRQDYQRTKSSYAELGKKYGVTGAMASRIIRNLSWYYI